MNITSLKVFDTGRYYGPSGQIIAAGVINREYCDITEEPIFTIAFVDFTRGISGIVETRDGSQRGILSAYDAGGYKHLSSCSETYKLLFAAAEKRATRPIVYTNH